MAGGIKEEDDVIAAINITPLVDVVLVLLIIFMITAPVIYQSSIPVQLPKAATGQDTENSIIKFTITKEGKLMMDTTEIQWSEIDSRIKALGNVEDQIAVISADEATPHGKVVELLDRLRTLGVLKAAMSVKGVPRR